MKSEWEFRFETRGFRFAREHKYTANPEHPVRLGRRNPEMIECLVRIVPKETKPPPYVEQVGSLFVLLPHSYEETKAFAFHVARIVAEQITFRQGDFRILGGLITCKRIAETPAEEAEFGDKLYNVEMHLVEVASASTFDSSQITAAPLSPQHLPLISLFNETKRDKSAVRQFLGYFRILESIYHTSNRISLKQALRASNSLQRIYAGLDEGGDYEALVSELVDVRHKCAHLKLSKGFGYSPVDPAVEREVIPHLQLLEAMAHASITGPRDEANVA